MVSKIFDSHVFIMDSCSSLDAMSMRYRQFLPRMKRDHNAPVFLIVILSLMSNKEQHTCTRDSWLSVMS